jgi:ubiquinone/menaquinone biosynthesis C-methylase UbiE
MNKQEVKRFWSENTCETNYTHSQKYSLNYFEELENYRYGITPEIFQFAQFTRWHNKKVLEIGVGAGTDFIQFAKAGTDIYGIDLTDEAIEHVNKRLEVYRLKGNVQVADAESVPFKDNTFDLVYSFGVLHHTPDTEKAISEAVRVTKHGGKIKLMLYNRHSVMSLWVYLRAVYYQRKLGSLSWAWAHGKESIGTKAFTSNEVRNTFNKLPVRILSIESKVNRYDYLLTYPKMARWITTLLINIYGHSRSGYFMTIEVEKL